ncbi:S9 family peptidase, partial [Pseudomonas syringae pv. tagetis]
IDLHLYRLALEASLPVQLTEGSKRYGGLFFSGGLILAVEEDHNTHRLVAITQTAGQRQLHAEGADIYEAPIISADG